MGRGLARGRPVRVALLVVACLAGAASLTSCAAGRPPARLVDDAVVASRVKAGLLRDPLLAGSAISVEVVDGIVTLTGRVPDEAAAVRAIETARGTEGVRFVQDRLTRREPGRASGAGRSGSPGTGAPGPRRTLP
ncbi:MAG TPA: BON domain-containing protein [Thermodesulfobacteriota bacterium]|nr:BON domain-containing protein [Thermodesulfobacteriota bacterium]